MIAKSGKQPTQGQAPLTTLTDPGAPVSVTLLTAGRDRPYALGLASELMSRGIPMDFVGSTIVDAPELHGEPLVRFLNLLEQRPGAGLFTRVVRILGYYLRLIRYAAKAETKVFHILWNNKFELFDRTVLMLYYRFLGKKIVLTAHNVNAGKRDSNDSWLNRASLRFQYSLCDCIFVHTERMKQQLIEEFRVSVDHVTVIPFGINNTFPNTTLSNAEARANLGLAADDLVLLFFGRIAPYKGLEYLVRAFELVSQRNFRYRLIIAGTPQDGEAYWKDIRQYIDRSLFGDKVIQRIQWISDDIAETYFKAADAFVLPYTYIFQSGILFLGYSFGLPVISSDVGSLKDEIVDGETGFVCKPRDALDLASAIERYFNSTLYRDLERQRQRISEYANARYSWTKVGAITADVYSSLLRR